MNFKANQRRTLTGIGLMTLAAACLTMAGCGSDPASPVTPAAPPAVDTAPPEIPTGLTAAAIDSHVKVAWLPNTTDGDIAGYLLYRVAFDQVWPLLDAPTQETCFFDESPLNRPCHYAVTAVDESGNESAWMQVHFSGVADRAALNRE